MKKNLLLFICLLTFQFTNAQWQQVNGPYGGNMHCLTSKGDTLYAGGIGAGVYRSIDNGSSWVSLNIPNTSTRTIAAVGTYLYAGSGFGAGVYRSQDNGNFWEEVNVGLPNQVGYGYPHVSAFASIGNNLFIGTDHGAFLSVNNGSSWAAINNGLTTQYGYVNCFAVKGDSLFAGADNGVFLSTNYGSSWMPLNTIMTNEVRSLLFNGTELYAGTVDGVYLSQNNGASWTSIGLAGIQVNALAVNGNTLFAGTYSSAYGGIFRTTDNGDNWNADTLNTQNLNVYSLITFGNNVLATGAVAQSNQYRENPYGGIFRLSSIPNHWCTSDKGIIATNVFSIITNSNGDFFAGTEGGGLTMSGNGMDWTSVDTNQAHSYYINSFAIDGSTVYANSKGGNLSVSKDNGANWSISQNVFGYSIAIKDHKLLIGSYGGIAISSDSGKTSLAASNIGVVNIHKFQCIVVKGNSIYAGTNNGANIYMSNNDGNNWTLVNNGLPTGNSNFEVKCLTTAGGDLYAGIYINYAPLCGVYRSTDDGNTWTIDTLGMGARIVQSILAKGDTLFAGTDNGIFYKTTNGSSWIDFNMGLKNKNILSMAYSGGVLYAGTNGSGIFVYEFNGQSTGVEKNYVTDNVIVFPNPSAGQFYFNGLEKENTIQIYDITGQLVYKTVVSNTKQTIDLKDKAKGIYFYKVSDKQKIITQGKIIVE